MDNIDFDLRAFAKDGYYPAPRKEHLGPWFAVFRVMWSQKAWVAVIGLRHLENAELAAIRYTHSVFAEEGVCRKYGAELFTSTVRAEMPVGKRRRINWANRVHVMFECTEEFVAPCLATAIAHWKAARPTGYTVLNQKIKWHKEMRVAKVVIGRQIQRIVKKCDEWREEYPDAKSRVAVITYRDTEGEIVFVPSKEALEEGDKTWRHSMPYKQFFCCENVRRFARSIFTDEEQYVERTEFVKGVEPVREHILYYAWESSTVAEMRATAQQWEAEGDARLAAERAAKASESDQQ